ncbi:ricin-type beta-trefoil lectin domain protein [Kitasatospora sp. NPDC097643]|uniref:ricin-type beta-trefoil lectin domain protein n=1 Tax=Kitasatospora sp. NPDC097643 TaxID=3157230 RepID=UPI0033177CB2
MRRIATMFATALLAGAAALTAPAAAGAAESTTQSAASSTVPGPGGVGSCTVNDANWNPVGTCTGIDPNQTWRVVVDCNGYDWTRYMPIYEVSPGNWVTGNGTGSTSCRYPLTPGMGYIQFGPAVPAGPVGQISGYANKCVDVRGGSTANGTPTQIWDCLGNVNQTWKIGTDGTIRALGKCLDVQGGRTGNATLVQTWDCNGTGAQQWQARPDGSLVNPQSGRCLDDLGFSTTNGNQLGIWDCNGAANQKWNLPA